MSGEDSAQVHVLSMALALYGCFAATTLLGVYVWEPLLMPACFTWPYPFLLSAQRFIPDPAGAASWTGALIVGLGLVAACALAAGRTLANKRMTWIQQLGVAALSIVCPLGVLTGVTWAVACAVGWPVGE